MDFPDDINVLHLIIIISSPLVKIFFPKVALILHAKLHSCYRSNNLLLS